MDRGLMKQITAVSCITCADRLSPIYNNISFVQAQLHDNDGHGIPEYRRSRDPRQQDKRHFYSRVTSYSRGTLQTLTLAHAESVIRRFSPLSARPHFGTVSPVNRRTSVSPMLSLTSLAVNKHPPWGKHTYSINSAVCNLRLLVMQYGSIDEAIVHRIIPSVGPRAISGISRPEGRSEEARAKSASLLFSSSSSTAETFPSH